MYHPTPVPLLAMEKSIPKARSQMHLYGPLFRTAWAITLDWATSYSLVSTTILAVISMVVSVAVIEFSFAQPQLMIRRIARLFVELVIGPLVIVGGMFVVSLIYYAPKSFLTQTSATVAQNARQEQQAADANQCRSQVAGLTSQITTLQGQLQTKQKQFDLEEKSFVEEKKRIGKLKPDEVSALRFVQTPIPSNDPNAPFGVKVVIQFTKSLSPPVQIFVICDQKIEKGVGGPVGVMMYAGGAGAAVGHPEAYGIKVMDQTLAADNPIVFRLYAKTAITALGVQVE
jgi:hypothetical protein